MNFKTIPGRVKNHFVKQVTLKEIHCDEAGNLTIELGLYRFFLPFQSIYAKLVTKEREIPLETNPKNNRLTLRIPAAKITPNYSFKVTLYYNGKKMTIKTGDEVNPDRALYHRDGYYELRVKRHLQFYSFLPPSAEFYKPVQATSAISVYDTLRLTLKEPLPETEEAPYVIAYRHPKMRILKTAYFKEMKQLDLTGFEHGKKGYWELYIQLDGERRPLSFLEDEQFSFPTKAHEIKAGMGHIGISLHYIPNVLRVEDVLIRYEEKFHQFRLTLMVDELDEDREYVFALGVPAEERHEEYQIEHNEDQFEVCLPAERLITDELKKKFFLINKTKGEADWRYRFHLSKGAVKKTESIFYLDAQAQTKKVRFYRRKDLTLGVIIKGPSLKRQFTEITDEVIRGTYGPLEGFNEVKVYFAAEERGHPEHRTAFPISEWFDIHLADIDWLAIKSQPKTIFDFYIEVMDLSTEEIIRRMKIQYPPAEYKKDNCYARFRQKDAEGNTHYFLVTTTALKRVKLESFQLPAGLNLPTDPAVKDDNLWLVGERTDTAQDNGIIFYQYLRKETNVDAYYIIDPESSDYPKIQDDPHVVAFGSDRHFELAAKAGVLAGTHDIENLLPYKAAPGYFGYENTFKVFLQHGILGRKNVKYHKKYYEDPFDLVIVSSDHEKYDIVVDQFGYDEEVVAVTGLARFDRLERKSKGRNILLMPTWRDWIQNDDAFFASHYFKAYIGLLQHPWLHRLLKEHDAQLYFYPHYRAQQFFKEAIGELPPRISFINQGEETVQELLQRHALLITDYSSVGFDFAIMHKPVIYYHFDRKRFFRQGILRPVEETFLGRIANRENELLNLIDDRLKDNFANYDVGLDSILKHEDHHNCERIYQSIIERL